MDKKRFAVISDLHSNIEATEAVLEDIKREGIEEIFCLGDVVGYGPNPNEVINLSEKFIFTIMGNHDEAVLTGKGLEDFNPLATEAALWTRGEIFYPAVSQELSDRNNQYLQDMKRIVKKEPFLFVHGSALSNMEYIDNYDATQATFRYMAKNGIKICFIGHTHRPGIFVEGSFNVIPYDTSDTHAIEENKKMIVNVGSVGQPRNHNHNACYVIVDDKLFYYRRVEYDVEKTIKKIYEIKQLDNYLGNRLR